MTHYFALLLFCLFFAQILFLLARIETAATQGNIYRYWTSQNGLQVGSMLLPLIYIYIYSKRMSHTAASEVHFDYPYSIMKLVRESNLMKEPYFGNTLEKY